MSGVGPSDVNAFTALPPTTWGHLASEIDPTIRGFRIDPSDRPWIPASYGAQKYLRLNLATSEWVILARIEQGQAVPYHKHHCPLNIWVLEGTLHFVDEGWSAGPGTFVCEPPGNTHVEQSNERTLLLVWSRGPIEFLNADNTPCEVRDCVIWKKEVEDYHLEYEVPMPPAPGYFF
jgi:quercetin dioxygenase-like cupin family protein